MFKKIFFLFFIIFFFLLFVFLGAAVIYSQQKNISIEEELATDSKRILLEIKSVIYSEAEKHNPPGDFVPDRIDDNLWGKLKGILN